MIQLNPYQTVGKVVSLPVEQIVPNPMQPRKVFDPEGLAQLAASIEQNGLLQPVVVTQEGPKKYALVAGERRLRAFELLGRSHIPAIVRRLEGQSGAVLALVENLQRRQLNFLEEAAAMAALMEAYGISQKELAGRLGIGASTLANKLRLLRLPVKLCGELLEAGLGERHARALLRLEDEDQQQRACEYLCKNKPTAAQTEKYVEQLLAKKGKSPARVFIIKDMRIFFNTMERAVQTMRQAGIPVDARQSEDEESIVYTVVVPKRAVVRRERNVSHETPARMA